MNIPVYFPKVNHSHIWPYRCWLLSVASKMDFEAKMTPDPLVKEDLIAHSSKIRGFLRKFNEVYDNPYLHYYSPG